MDWEVVEPGMKGFAKEQKRLKKLDTLEEKALIRKVTVAFVKRELDRIVITPVDVTKDQTNNYVILAPIDCGVTPGDIIRYKHCAANFGAFMKVMKYA